MAVLLRGISSKLWKKPFWHRFEKRCSSSTWFIVSHQWPFVLSMALAGLPMGSAFFMLIFKQHLKTWQSCSRRQGTWVLILELLYFCVWLYANLPISISLDYIFYASTYFTGLNEIIRMKLLKSMRHHALSLLIISELVATMPKARIIVE